MSVSSTLTLPLRYDFFFLCTNEMEYPTYTWHLGKVIKKRQFNQGGILSSTMKSLLLFSLACCKGDVSFLLLNNIHSFIDFFFLLGDLVQIFE